MTDKIMSLEAANQDLKEQIKAKDEGRKAELQKIQEQSQNKLAEIKQQEAALFEERYKVWDQERTFMQQQICYFQQQVDENKKMHETLLLAINNAGSKENTGEQQQLLLTNQTLSETISKVEARNQQL